MNQSGNNSKSKKAKLIETTAEELFQKYGFRRVTVEEICQKAGVSKMTFYKYFSNKDELFKHMLNRWFDESEAKVSGLKLMDIPFAEKIRLILQLKEEFLSKLSHEFIVDYINPGPGLNAFMKDFFDKGINLFIDFIKDAQKKGDVRQSIRPEFLLAVLNKIVELAKDTKLMDLYPNAMDFSLEINNFFCCGILPLVMRENKNA